jgi:hypothetical protein
VRAVPSRSDQVPRRSFSRCGRRAGDAGRSASVRRMWPHESRGRLIPRRGGHRRVLPIVPDPGISSLTAAVKAASRAKPRAAVLRRVHGMSTANGYLPRRLQPHTPPGSTEPHPHHQQHHQQHHRARAPRGGNAARGGAATWVTLALSRVYATRKAVTLLPVPPVRTGGHRTESKGAIQYGSPQQQRGH